MVNKIEKGKRFEREVAKWLSRLTGKRFRRVPMSGGFGTMGAKDRKFRGDVFCDDEECGCWENVVVECKITKEKISISDIMANKNSIFWKWIRQAIKESRDKDGNYYWLLVFRDGTHKTYIVTEEIEFFNEFYIELYNSCLEGIVSMEHIRFSSFRIDEKDPPRYLRLWMLKKDKEVDKDGWI